MLPRSGHGTPTVINTGVVNSENKVFPPSLIPSESPQRVRKDTHGSSQTFSELTPEGVKNVVDVRITR